MKHNLKSSSKGYESSEFFYKRKKNSLSLNPKTFLEISLPSLLRLRGFELGDWCKGWASPVGEEEQLAESSQGRLSWGGIEINKFPGWGNHCEGC